MHQVDNAEAVALTILGVGFKKDSVVCELYRLSI
jgi:hypothetical protein